MVSRNPAKLEKFRNCRAKWSAVRGVLFDVDGTLIDSSPVHIESWRTAFSEAGWEVPATLFQGQMGRRKPEIVSSVLSEIDAGSVSDKVVYEIISRKSQLFTEHIQSVLHVLEADVGVGTSNLLLTQNLHLPPPCRHIRLGIYCRRSRACMSSLVLYESQIMLHVVQPAQICMPQHVRMSVLFSIKGVSAQSIHPLPSPCRRLAEDKSVGFRAVHPLVLQGVECRASCSRQLQGTAF